MELPAIIQDSREQDPLQFPVGVSVQVGTLGAGDYSLSGLEELCAVERKSLPDLVSCCTNSNRQRFRSELHRLQAYRCRAVVVEATFEDAVQGRYRSQLKPQCLIASVSSWQIRYSVPFVWATDTKHAATATLQILRQFFRQCQEFKAKLEV